MPISADVRRERARLREKKKRASPAGRAAHNKYRNQRHAANRGAYNAQMRGFQNRQREQRDFFNRVRDRKEARRAGDFGRAGCTILNALQLQRPLFIFELRGQRHFEYWTDIMVKKRADTKALEQLEQWNIRIAKMADDIEADVDSVAKQNDCPAELILDALTLELTGRFIGRVRDRDEQILKTQPII